MVSSCPFCRLADGDQSEHKTEWFYLGMEGVVVEDLNAKGHAMRLLFVPTSHMPCGEEIVGDHNLATQLLYSVGRALCIERGLVLRALDLTDHSYTEHWHAQLNLDLDRAKGEGA